MEEVSNQAESIHQPLSILVKEILSDVFLLLLTDDGAHAWKLVEASEKGERLNFGWETTKKKKKQKKKRDINFYLKFFPSITVFSPFLVANFPSQQK